MWSPYKYSDKYNHIIKPQQQKLQFYEAIVIVLCMPFVVTPDISAEKAEKETEERRANGMLNSV